MTVPPRVRLLKNCFDHKYSELRKTLATDKQLRELPGLKRRIERAYELMCTPKKRKVFCINADCGFTDTFTPDEFGIEYYQAIGTCPGCGSLMAYKNGKYTKEEISFSVKEVSNG